MLFGNGRSSRWASRCWLVAGSTGCLRCRFVPAGPDQGRASGATISRTCFLRMSVTSRRPWSPAGMNPARAHRARSDDRRPGARAALAETQRPAISAGNRQLDRIRRRPGTVGSVGSVSAVSAISPVDIVCRDGVPDHDTARYMASVCDAVEGSEDVLLDSGSRLGGDPRGRKSHPQRPVLARSAVGPRAQSRE